MAYRVSLAAPAETDAYAAFERIREVAPACAENGSGAFTESLFLSGKTSNMCGCYASGTASR